MSYFKVLAYQRSQGSSVNLVPNYGLDNQDSIPGRTKDFSSSLCVQTCSGGHPASYLWIKLDGPNADHTHTSSAKVRNE
jgi:hypothetical protein